MDKVLTFLADAKKAVVVGLGFALTLLSYYHDLPFLPYQGVVPAVIAVLTTLLTWLVPNSKG